LYKGFVDFAQWSRDSRFLYFLRFREKPAILRVPVTGGDAEVVADLKGFPIMGRSTGTRADPMFSRWFGLDPEDAPLVLHNETTGDVYALTLETP